jgi:hypothetical protein
VSVCLPPVIPSATPRERLAGALSRVTPAGEPLPLPTLVPQRTTTCVYGLAALDVHGRLADRTIMQALGWSPGRRLHLREAAGLVVVQAHPDGEFQITRQGHLRLPALIRHRCGLAPGDRVLLAADPPQHSLIAYPPAALDTFLTQQCSELLGGESA